MTAQPTDRWIICDKWPLDLYVQVKRDPGAKHRPYRTRAIWDIAREALCKEAILRFIPPPLTALDFFGGLGVGAAILRGMHAPARHILCEIDRACRNHLHKNGFATVLGDAYEWEAEQADLVDADFDTLTILRAKRDPALMGFLCRLFTTGHRQILITDAAVSRLHLNARYYKPILEADCDTLRSYLEGVSMYFNKRFGYSIVAVEYHSGAAYTLWRQGNESIQSFQRTFAYYPGVAVDRG